MYVMLVYDVEQKRVGKALKLCRAYLNWVQNSVFEGEITEGKLKELKIKLKKILKKDKDSLLIYKFSSVKMFEKEIIGQEKAPVDTII